MFLTALQPDIYMDKSVLSVCLSVRNCALLCNACSCHRVAVIQRGKVFEAVIEKAILGKERTKKKRGSKNLRRKKVA